MESNGGCILSCPLLGLEWSPSLNNGFFCKGRQETVPFSVCTQDTSLGQIDEWVENMMHPELFPGMKHPKTKQQRIAMENESRQGKNKKP